MHIQLMDKECKKDKGIKKVVVKNHLTVKDYVDVAYSHEPQFRMQTVLRSHRHEMFTERVNKKALSADDDKRVIMPDKISTLAIGHWRLQEV
jgi:hypothetical protein